MDSVTVPPLVSICIPTFNRPSLLRAALESCFAQTFQNFEILVGDDSKENESQLVVSALQGRYPDKIRYLRNTPPLGQAENVNLLLQHAAGGRLILLHDDDLLLPQAVQDLWDCWRHTPALTAAFGKQHIVNMKGDILFDKSEALNREYSRTSETAGAVAPGLAGIVRMFPNDGYMVLTERARKVGFRPASEVGEACDFDFALQYCADDGLVWFHNGYTSAYRISDDAISRTALTAPFVYRILTEYRTRRAKQMAPQIQQALGRAIETFAPSAVSGYARTGQGFQALRILISSDYPLRERFRLRFALHGALTFSALIGGSSGANAVLTAREWFSGTKNLHEISG